MVVFEIDEWRQIAACGSWRLLGLICCMALLGLIYCMAYWGQSAAWRLDV